MSKAKRVCPVKGGQGGTGTSNYNDLSNKPKIGGVILSGNKTAHDLGLATEEAVAGKYSKPTDGIPSTDLTDEVQQSLVLADTALQEVPNTYRTSAEQDAIDSGKASKTLRQVVTELTSAIELQPNVLYVLNNVDATLAVTLATPTDNTIVNEYMVEFDTGATSPSVSFPSEVMFPTPLTIEANRRYQISIIDNIALYVSAQLPTE